MLPVSEDEILLEEGWIGAAEAMKILRTAYSRGEAHEAVSRRAFKGSLASRATTLKIDEEIRNLVPLPKEFWAGGFARDPYLYGDWTSGIFVTSHKALGELEAYGVQFVRSQIESMVVAKTRPDDSDKSRKRSPGRPRSEAWNDWIPELVAYFHENGIPPGEGSQGQEVIMRSIDDRLSEKGLKSLSRGAAQPVVQAALDRLRAANN